MTLSACGETEAERAAREQARLDSLRVVEQQRIAAMMAEMADTASTAAEEPSEYNSSLKNLYKHIENTGTYIEFYNNLYNPLGSGHSTLSTYDNYLKNNLNSQYELLDELIVFGDSNDMLPYLDTILNRPLIFNGQEIEEDYDPYYTAGGVECSRDTKQPVILFSKNLNPFTTLYIRSFLRDHEYAHIKLRHISCIPEPIIHESKENELEADCEAAKTLKKLGEDGIKLAEYAAVILEAIVIDSSDTHPIGSKRKYNILTCLGK